MSKQAGFTFLELLFSLGLFMIGLYGVVGLQIAVFAGNQRASDVTLATNLCSNVLEELHIRDVSAAPSGETLYFDIYGAQKNTASYFKVVWVDTSASPDLGYNDYNVTATWLRPKEVATANWPGHTVSLNTRVVKKVSP